MHILDISKAEASNNITTNVSETKGGGKGTNGGGFQNGRGRGQRAFGAFSSRGGRYFQGFQGVKFNSNFSAMQKQQQLVYQLCGKDGHLV